MDNVFITSVVTVQYQVLREKVYEAFYSLTNPIQQMTVRVENIVVTLCIISKCFEIQK